jgi:hypothetical protein
VASPAEKPLRLDGRLALRPKEAAAGIGLSERAFRAILSEVPHARVGGAVLIPVDELRRWIGEQCRVQKSRADRIADELLGEMQRSA